jgi:hypothetical protein
MPSSRAEQALTSILLAAAALLLAAAPAGAAPTHGGDPAWVVSNYLDHRLYGTEVADYPYVCAQDREWSPGGIALPNGAPFAAEQDSVLDIRSYDAASIRVYEARNHDYRVVTVDVAGYERAETRTFILAPTSDVTGGESYCIGQLA